MARIAFPSVIATPDATVTRRTPNRWTSRPAGIEIARIARLAIERMNPVRDPSRWNRSANEGRSGATADHEVSDTNSVTNRTRTIPRRTASASRGRRTPGRTDGHGPAGEYPEIPGSGHRLRARADRWFGHGVHALWRMARAVLGVRAVGVRDGAVLAMRGRDARGPRVAGRGAGQLAADVDPVPRLSLG